MSFIKTNFASLQKEPLTLDDTWEGSCFSQSCSFYPWHQLWRHPCYLAYNPHEIQPIQNNGGRSFRNGTAELVFIKHCNNLLAFMKCQVYMMPQTAKMSLTSLRARALSVIKQLVSYIVTTIVIILYPKSDYHTFPLTVLGLVHVGEHIFPTTFKVRCAFL